MDKKLQEDYIKYLSKVCKDPILRQGAIDFLVDLSEFYEGQTFSRENFEKINIDGKTYEQDVVNKIFKDKDSATAAEVFFEIFKDNIKSIDSYRYDILKPKSTAGFANICEEKVLIKRPQNDADFLSNIDKDAFETQKDDLLERPNEQMKHVLYHELSHVFETKTFNNRRYVCVGMRNAISEKKFNRYISYHTKNENGELLKVKIYNKREVSKAKIDPKDYFAMLESDGKKEISEVLNEEHASKLDKTINIKEKLFVELNKEFARKTELCTGNNCAYNVNYDIAGLLLLAAGDIDKKNFRFNPQALWDKVNNLKIDEKVLSDSKNLFLENFLQYVEFGKLQSLDSQKDTRLLEMEENAIMQNIGASRLDSLLGCMMSYANISSFHPGLKKICLDDKMKLSIQEILVDGIKNDWIQKINDPKIEKNEEFFAQLNDVLTKIDNNIIYPNQQAKFHTGILSMRKENVWVKTIDTKREIDCLPINKMIEKHKNDHEYDHLRVFDEFVGAAQKAVEMHKNVENIDEIMTFFASQRVLEAKYNDLVNREVQVRRDEQKIRQEMQTNGKKFEIIDALELDSCDIISLQNNCDFDALQKEDAAEKAQDAKWLEEILKDLEKEDANFWEPWKTAENENSSDFAQSEIGDRRDVAQTSEPRAEIEKSGSEQTSAPQSWDDNLSEPNSTNSTENNQNAAKIGEINATKNTIKNTQKIQENQQNENNYFEQEGMCR